MTKPRGLNNEEARFRVIAALATQDVRVFEGRAQAGRRASPDVVVMDRTTGALSRVRVMVGKRPRSKAGRLYFDPERVGPHADTLALVHPLTGAIDLRPVPPRSNTSHVRCGDPAEIRATTR